MDTRLLRGLVYLLLLSLLSISTRASYDLNDDDVVDSKDIGVFLNAWGSENSQADFDENGIVDSVDFNLLLALYGEISNPVSPPTLGSLPGVTSLNPLPISGNSTPNAIVNVYSDGQLQKSFQSGADGMFANSVYLDDGVNNFSFTIVDRVSGEESAHSNPFFVNYVNVESQIKKGTIAESVVWTKGTHPYYEVTEDLNIEGDLVIMPGVEVRVADGVTLETSNIDIRGTAEAPVRIKSANVVDPTDSSWRGLEIPITATVSIEYLEIMHASTAIHFSFSGECMPGRECSSLTIKNSVLSNNQTAIALRPGEAGSDIKVLNNMIFDNFTGIGLANGAAPIIQGNTIRNNYYGINLGSSTAAEKNPTIYRNNIYENQINLDARNYYYNAKVIDARENWWGSAVLSEIALSIRDRSDESRWILHGVVDYSKPLDKDNGLPLDLNYFPLPLEGDTIIPAGEYEVLAHIEVPEGGSLTLEAGVKLNFHQNTLSIYADGAFKVEGTAENKVVFTSDLLSGWGSIAADASLPTSKILIDHAVIRKAGIAFGVNRELSTPVGPVCDRFCLSNSEIVDGSNSVWINETEGVEVSNNYIHDNYRSIEINRASPKFINNTITNNYQGGFDIGVSSHPLIIGNTIANNDDLGILVDPSGQGDSFPIINRNKIFDNRHGNLLLHHTFQNPDEVVIDARENWWGSADLGDVVETIHDSNDRAGRPTADISNRWFDENGLTLDVNSLSGVISEDTELLIGQNYETSSNLVVDSEATLTLQAGAKLNVAADMSVDGRLILSEGAELRVYSVLTINGVILVSGTPEKPVVMRSGSARNNWQGILISELATEFKIEHAIIQDADIGIEVLSLAADSGNCDFACVKNSTISDNTRGVSLKSSGSLFVENIIQNNENEGLIVNGASPKILANSLLKNATAISIVGGSNPEVQGNFIQYNLRDGIYISSSSPHIISNIIIQNGSGAYDDAGIDIKAGSNPVIDGGNQITNNNKNGIIIEGDGSTPSNDPLPVVNGNHIANNYLYDVNANAYADRELIIDFSGNFWEVDSESELEPRIADRSTSYFHPIVDTSSMIADPVAAGFMFIDNLNSSNKVIHPIIGDNLELTFDLVVENEAEVIFRITSELKNNLIYEYATTLLAGDNILTWDGKDSEGNYVGDEAYVFDIIARRGRRQSIHSPRPLSLDNHFPGTSFDSSYSPFTNDFLTGVVNLQIDGRVSLSSSREDPDYFVDNVPYLKGMHNFFWDGRARDGSIVRDISSIFVHDIVPFSSNNIVIVKGTKPSVSGTGPSIEVKSNPYRITHSYDQISSMSFNISMDSLVTVLLLDPDENDIDSPNAEVLVDNQLLLAKDGDGIPVDHFVEWRGYDPADTNNIHMAKNGAHTFVIKATSQLTGQTTVYRGVLQLYQ